MLIETLIKPKPDAAKQTRDVSFFGKNYKFTNVGDGHFVADIDDPKAIECALKFPKTYRQYTQAAELARGGDDKAAKAAAEKAEAEAAEAAAKAVAAQNAREGEDAKATQLEADITALLSSTPQAIKKIIEKKTPSREVLEGAHALEKASTKPRQNVLNLLSGTLSSIED